jgi:hypothetical protein
MTATRLAGLIASTALLTAARCTGGTPTGGDLASRCVCMAM